MMNEIIAKLFQQGPGYVMAVGILLLFFYQQKDFKKTLNDNTRVIRELSMIVSRLEGIFSMVGERLERRVRDRDG